MDRRRFLHSRRSAPPCRARLLRQPAPRPRSPVPRALLSGRRRAWARATSRAAPDGTIWFNGQRNGTLGRLDPRDGSYKLINLGPGAAPARRHHRPRRRALDHRRRAERHRPRRSRRPQGDAVQAAGKARPTPTSTPACSTRAASTGSPARAASTAGSIRSPATCRSGTRRAAAAPYGITLTPQGRRLVRLARRQPHRQDRSRDRQRARSSSRRRTDQGARRIWSDSKGRLWVSEWNSGNVSMHDPADGSWQAWKLPGERPRTYSVYVDDKDIVWLTDFGANAIVRFDPATEKFHIVPERQAERQCPADGRPARPGLGRRIRHQPAGGDRDRGAAELIGCEARVRGLLSDAEHAPPCWLTI